ncbi:unnamed protein product [Effrenium voratum]|nr:unnamed protein product [Effrenium voratum]
MGAEKVYFWAVHRSFIHPCLGLPLYTSVATTFADLHDRTGRMKAKGVIREGICWKDSRRFFFWRVKRRLLQDFLIARLQKADEKLTHGAAEALIEKWAEESKVDVKSDRHMVAWLEAQDVEARAATLRDAFLKSHIKESSTDSSQPRSGRVCWPACRP